MDDNSKDGKYSLVRIARKDLIFTEDIRIGTDYTKRYPFINYQKNCCYYLYLYNTSNNKAIELAYVYFKRHYKRKECQGPQYENSKTICLKRRKV